MNNRIRVIAAATVAGALAGTASGAGLTLITHGLKGDADGWVQAMANAVASYSPATTNAALYRFEFFPKPTDGTSALDG